VPLASEDALRVCRLLARAGLFVGPSSGAYVHAAAELARGGRHHTVVTLLNDSGERYLSTGMWDHEASAGGTDHA
jgi:cysteine synthase B